MASIVPSERLRRELDEIVAGVAGEEDPIEAIGLGARLILQQALEEELTEFLSRERYGSSTTICARCGRCFGRGRAPFSAPPIGRARFAGSISGSRRGRFRSALARRAAAMSWSAVCRTRAPAPGRWSSRRKRQTCCTAWASACASWAGCRRHWCGTAKGRYMPAAVTRSEPFAAFCGALGVGWRLLEARDPQSRGVMERLRLPGDELSSPAARSRTSSTSRSSSTAVLISAPTSASTVRCAAGRSIG